MRKLVPLLALFVPSLSWGFGMVVQSTAMPTTTSVTSATVTFNSNFILGDRIIVIAHSGNATLNGGATAISDTLGTSFTLVGSTNTGVGACAALQYYGVPTSGGADTIQITFNNSNTHQIAAFEVSGLASSAFDTTSTSATLTASTVVTSSEIIVSQPSEYLVANGCSSLIQTSAGWTAGDGYTLQFKGISGRTFYEDRNVSNGGTYTASATSSQSTNLGIVLVAYKNAPLLVTHNHTTFQGKIIIGTKAIFQ